MNKNQIKDLALSNGFKLKQQPTGERDLNPYVYDFAEALLAKANERIEKLTERCKPSKVIMIDGSGHYVSESVYKEIKQLRKEQEHG